jgi:hypothetical protein
MSLYSEWLIEFKIQKSYSAESFLYFNPKKNTLADYRTCIMQGLAAVNKFNSPY